MKKYIIIGLVSHFLLSCGSHLASIPKGALKPNVITQPTTYDTDDPAIWVNKKNPEQSLIIGTDKEIGGGLYLYDLKGNIVKSHLGMQRPNNVDIAYEFPFGDKKIDIAVVTERKSKTIRVFSLPDLKPIDQGGIPIFEGEEEGEFREGMGIALYTKDEKIYAIVGRKSGPKKGYLWQYLLLDNGNGAVGAKKVRAFGAYSGKKEIEAIAVDNALGFVYYSDEMHGIRKYYADPEMGDEELALFGTQDFKRDQEGIAIYEKDDKTGYILVSDQQRNFFNVYKREGEPQNSNSHKLIAKIPVSTIECDGAEVTNANLGEKFPRGMLVAMSNGKVFHYYDWKKIQHEIDKQNHLTP